MHARLSGTLDGSGQNVQQLNCEQRRAPCSAPRSSQHSVFIAGSITVCIDKPSLPHRLPTGQNLILSGDSSTGTIVAEKRSLRMKSLSIPNIFEREINNYFSAIDFIAREIHRCAGAEFVSAARVVQSCCTLPTRSYDANDTRASGPFPLASRGKRRRRRDASSPLSAAAAYKAISQCRPARTASAIHRAVRQKRGVRRQALP